MEKTEIFKYYAFGHDFGLLKDSFINYQVPFALRIFNSFFNSLKDLDLPVTIKIAEKLSEIHEELKLSKEATVSESISKRITDEVRKIEPALDAELHLSEVYVLTKKRYPLQTLLQNTQELLGTDVFSKLSDTAKKDFNFACKLIALDQPTAAAFHLMRALEQQVKMLYFEFKKTKRLEKLMWGPVIAQLRQKRAPKPTEKLLSHLDGMRVHFRNPTQHPDIFYSLDEAQDLLNETITALNILRVPISAYKVNSSSQS